MRVALLSFQPKIVARLLSSLVRHVRCLALLGPVMLLGCSATTTVSLAEGPREYVASDYEHVLSRWTRTEHMVTLSELDDLLTVTATFESWDFRWAYVVRYAEDYRLSIEQRRALLDSTLAETRTHYQFFIALYGNRRRWAELAKPTSGWVVRLFDDRGNETAPEAIVAIAKPGAIETTYFPYTTPWRQVFRVKFPAVTPSGPTIAPDATLVGLRVAGAQGSEELYWKLERRSARSGGPQAATPREPRLHSGEDLEQGRAGDGQLVSKMARAE